MKAYNEPAISLPILFKSVQKMKICLKQQTKPRKQNKKKGKKNNNNNNKIKKERNSFLWWESSPRP